MAQNWNFQLTTWAELWNIPTDVKTKLKTLTTKATTDLALATEANRNPGNTAKCNASFKGLTEYMRDIKKRHFFQPPLRDEDIVNLGLKLPDTTPTPIAVPPGQAAIVLSHPGYALVMAVMSHNTATPYDERACHGYRVHYGVVPSGNVTQDLLDSKEYYIKEPPKGGLNLAASKFTRRKKDTFDFTDKDVGGTVYFAVRYENSKGERGPWSPLYQTVIS